jgi:molybdopterin synthase sulfur carrier subunit
MPRVRVLQPIQKTVGGKDVVEAAGTTVAQILDSIEAQHEGFKAKLFNERGEVHRFINIYVNDEDIRFLENLDTVVGDGDKVAIIPAIAGGHQRASV